MLAQPVVIFIVVSFDGRFLDRAVHALSLTDGPMMIDFGEAMFDAVLSPSQAELARRIAPAAEENATAVIVSAKIESEIAVLPPDEQKEYLAAVGLEVPGLNRVIRAGYALLRLITFFTAGPKETRAWTVPQSTKAPQRA